VGDLGVEKCADCTDRQDRHTTLNQPKDVDEKFGDRLTYRFLLLCQVNEDDNLPGLYNEWDARPKGVSEHYMMQQDVDMACVTLNLTTFQVSPVHVSSLEEFLRGFATFGMIEHVIEYIVYNAYS
jgi:hypothetical protein